MNFWFIAVLLLFIACLFLLIPSWKFAKKSNQRDENNETFTSLRRKENVGIFKERLAELDAEKSAGRLTEEHYQQMLTELETSLLVDVQIHGETDTIEPTSRFKYVFLGFGLLFIVVFSVMFYKNYGAMDLVDQYYAEQFSPAELARAEELAKQGDMSALLEQLYAKLKQAPDNIEGWQLLARSAVNTERFDLASEAYLNIIRIYDANNENPAAIYGLLAQTKYYQAEGVFNSDIERIVDRALSLDPDELNSLGLLAINAFTEQRYEEAKALWERVLIIYPEHPARASIEAGIQRINAQLGMPDDISKAATDSATSEKARVMIVVTLDEQLKHAIDPDDTLFVVAGRTHALPGQPNFPLAVSRHKASELPLKITLDDSMAMTPQAKLSMAEWVTITARISKSGNPLPQSGDFEAVSADIKPLDQASIELVIQSELK